MGFLDFELTPAAPLSIASLLVSLGIGLPLSLVLRWHFQKFGSTLSNRSEFAQVFPDAQVALLKKLYNFSVTA